MPRLEYHGPHDAVVVPALGLTCKRGEAVDVPAAVAADLLEQESNWRRPAAKKEG